MRSDGAPFRCQACSKTFARREHLRRHEQAHAGSPSPSNQCTTCGKYFSRRDALLRHRSLHVASPSFGGPRSRAATNRIKRACARCSRQKLKCDGQVPCVRCGAKGHPCSYPESPPSQSATSSSHLMEPQRSSSDMYASPQGSITTPRDEYGVMRDVGRSRDHGAQTHQHQHPQQASSRDQVATTRAAGWDRRSAMEDDGAVREQQERQEQQQHPPPPPPPPPPPLPPLTPVAAARPREEQPQMDAADDGTFDWLFSSSLFPSAWPLEEEAVVEKQLPIAYERTTPTELPNTSVVGPDEGRVRFHMLGSPHPATLLAENTCQVAPLLQVAKDRLLLLPTLAQQIPDEEKQGTQKMLAAVSPETLNVFVQLFFQHFDRLCSVVHRPTFDPNYCEVFLLGAICALGSMYSAIENASRFGHSLMSLVNRAIFGVWPRTREYGRSLPFIQALLLNFNFFRSSGTREMLELAESLRSPLTTMIRKCRLLEPGEGRHPEDWKAWVECETKKRTAWAYFTADMELSMVWSLAPSFAFDELNAELPGDEARWRAASAATWRSIGDNSPRILLNQLHTDPHALYLCGSGAQKVVFSSSLCSLGTSLHSMRSSCLDAVIDMATSQLVQACQALRFSGTSTALPELLLRFMMLISTIDTYDLQALVRATDTDAAFERVERRLARANALEHVLVQAGRIVGLCRTQASESLYEGCFFFYAASALYGCSRVLLGRGLPVDCSSQRIDGLAALSPATGEPFRPLLEGIGDITALDAPWRILNHYSSYLLNRPLRTSWPITGLLGRFLADMASAVVASSGLPASTPGRIVSRV